MPKASSISNGFPAKKIEKYEEFAETMISSYRTMNRVAYEIENDPPEFLRMKNWYVRLKEKFKHDIQKLLQLAEDWKDYAYNLSSKNTNHYLYLENGENNRVEKAREAHLKIEEIENRFSEMLGSKERETIEVERKKKDEEAEAFWRLDKDKK